jgi:hypothetical protein
MFTVIDIKQLIILAAEEDLPSAEVKQHISESMILFPEMAQKVLANAIIVLSDPAFDECVTQLNILYGLEKVGDFLRNSFLHDKEYSERVLTGENENTVLTDLESKYGIY